MCHEHYHNQAAIRFLIIFSQIKLRPSEIRFTQDSINGYFSSGIKLSESLAELLSGEKTPAHFEKMKVCEFREAFWAVTGNRRLFLFKILESLDIVDTISVSRVSLNDDKTREIFQKRYTTVSDGKDVVVRVPEIAAEIKNMVQKWLTDHKGKPFPGRTQRNK